jgi:NTP pyrophosphatase (non-canonical NTP hydrolase)
MEIEKYQVSSSRTAIYLDAVNKEFPNLPGKLKGLLALSYISLGLVGEAGELSNKIKKLIRDSVGEISDELRKDLSKELGDCLWYIANICTELQLDLNEIAQQNLDKLLSRKERGVLTGSGDNR